MRHFQRKHMKQVNNTIIEIQALFTPHAVRLNVDSENSKESGPSSLDYTSQNCNDILVRLGAHFHYNWEFGSDEEEELQELAIDVSV